MAAPSPSPEQKLLIRHIVNDLARHWPHSIGNRHFIRLRLYTYYDALRRISLRWFKLKSAFDEAIRQKLLLPVPSNDQWVALPTAFAANGHLRTDADATLQQQLKIHSLWVEAATSAAGPHFERLFRRDIPQQEIWLNEGALQVTDKTSRLQIDAFCISHQLVIELKNSLSDVFHALTITNQDHWTKDMRKIYRVFEWTKGQKARPVLVAPFIDPSFFGYQSAYGGFCMATLFQILPTKYEELCSQIKAVLRYSNIIASDKLPAHIIKRFSDLVKERQ